MDAERVFYRYGGVMLRHAQLLLGRDSLAEDAVQETLVRVIRLNPSLRDEVHEKAWLLAVTGNICRDMLRKARRRREVDLPGWFDHPSPGHAPDEAVSRKDRDARLRRAVMDLPVKYREPVLLVYYHELTNSQAAEAMGITDSAFRTRLMRARDLLRKTLGEEAEL